MEIYKYQEISKRTIPTDNWKTALPNFCMGLAGESGELIDHLKKLVYHNHFGDKEYIEKELGDIMWYIAAIATTLEIDLSKVLEINIDKLKQRYPNGFTSIDSKNREE